MLIFPALHVFGPKRETELLVDASLLFVQIQLMCGAAIINLLSVNASSDDPNQLNVF